MECILNPKTRRLVKVGGKVYKTLVRSGAIDDVRVKKFKVTRVTSRVQQTKPDKEQKAENLDKEQKTDNSGFDWINDLPPDHTSLAPLDDDAKYEESEAGLLDPVPSSPIGFDDAIDFDSLFDE